MSGQFFPNFSLLNTQSLKSTLHSSQLDMELEPCKGQKMVGLVGKILNFDNTVV